MVIGLCGKSGSGKSTIAKLIVETKSNAFHYDIDKIGYQVMEIPEVQNEAIKCFGEQIVTNGQIDRKKLAEMVFNSIDEMNKLAGITWKHMMKVLDAVINDNKDKIVILDWILLSKTKYFDMCDLKILVDMPLEIRRQRAMKRDNITSSDFDLREKASITYDNSKFDMVVKCNDINEVRKMVKKI